MSKGLEALKDIYNSLINDIEQEEDEFYNPSDDIKYWEEKYNIVKQDLDRLEQLEEERANYDWEKDVINSLQQENQELKNKNSALEFWNECYAKENEKLKKVIEILKNKLGLYVNDYINYATINAVLPVANNDCNRLTQQEYELLKEVLVG